jgi:hypothetical protein
MSLPLQISKTQHVVICRQCIEVVVISSHFVGPRLIEVDYYNEGAMDLITYVFVQDIDKNLADFSI